MQGLRKPVVGIDVVAAVGVRAVREFDLRALAHPRQRAPPRQLVLEFVVAGDPPHEDPVLLAAVMRFDAHFALRLFRHYTLRLQRPAVAVRLRSRSAWRNFVIAAMRASRPALGAARVLAEYQGFDGHGNGLRGHANAPQVDILEIAQDASVDYAVLAFP